jgi:outer membrane protein TolC
MKNRIIAAGLGVLMTQPAMAAPVIIPQQLVARVADEIARRPVEASSADAQPLGALLAEALRNNPEIQAAARGREAARQRIAPAGALDDPMLEAGVLNVPVESLRFDREDMTMKMIGLSQKFPYPGKRDLREAVAAIDAESVSLAYQEMVNRVARDVKIAYLDLSLVAESARLVQKNILTLGQFLSITESRYGVGQGTQSDVLKAQIQLSKMREELLRLGREQPVIEAELGRTLGRAANAVALTPAMPALQEPTLDLKSLNKTALETRPQLLALQRIVARNEKTLELARKDYYPDFDVRFAYGQRDRAPDGMKREDVVSLTVAMNLPVWRGNKRDPRVAETQAMRDQALGIYQAQQNELYSKLRQQTATAEQSFRSARLYANDILPQARLAVDAALAAYKVNRVDFLTLLDSQMTVLNYELGYATAVVNQNKALAEIDLLTGRPVLQQARNINEPGDKP